MGQLVAGKPGGEDVSQDVWPDDTEVPDMQMEDIRRAAWSFKARASCPCGLHPKHLGMVSNEVLGLIARQWTIWERYGQVPRKERLLIVTLINKPDGGLRPIVLSGQLTVCWPESMSKGYRTGRLS